VQWSLIETTFCTNTKISIARRHFTVTADFPGFRVPMALQHPSADSQNQTWGWVGTPSDLTVLAMNVWATDARALTGLLMKAQVVTARVPMAAEAEDRRLSCIHVNNY
jgi:hypothetical protein